MFDADLDAVVHAVIVKHRGVLRQGRCMQVCHLQSPSIDSEPAKQPSLGVVGSSHEARAGKLQACTEVGECTTALCTFLSEAFLAACRAMARPTAGPCSTPLSSSSSANALRAGFCRGAFALAPGWRPYFTFLKPVNILFVCT